MSTVKTQSKLIARRFSAAFGGSPSVSAYWDESRTNYVDILHCNGSIQNGIVSLATVTLSLYPIYRKGSVLPFRVEILAACAQEDPLVANVLATSAFMVMKDRKDIFPGAVFLDVISLNGLLSTLQHVMFVPPFLWTELSSFDVENIRIAPLLMVPISEQERVYASKHGSDALESIFEDKQIDIFNINRASVL